MATTRRSRTRDFNLGSRIALSGKFYVDGTSNIVLNQNLPTVAVGNQVTDSEGHLWPPKVKGAREDIGGEFKTYRQYCSPPTSVDWSVASVPTPTKPYSQVDRYRGPICPKAISGSAWFPSPVFASDGDLDALGAEAIARCKPTNSVADASVAIGELYREGLPHLFGSSTWKARSLSAQSAGDDYLNVVFGWLPLINEIRSFAGAVDNGDAILRQYERDSGRNVRRRYDFPTSVKTEVDVVSSNQGCYGPPYSMMSVYQGTLTRSRKIVTDTWFTGCFTYYLPDGKDYRSEMMRKALLAKKLFGISLTPATLWNLAPWSWAADWFSNTGDVISNLTDWSVDGLIMRYGYVMQTVSVTDTYTLTGLQAPRWKPQKVTAFQSFTTISKRRRKANPFGFGVSWDGLSSFQLSVIAALGMSRGR